MKASRNDACPCGSGLKFKKCCLQKAAPIPPSSTSTVALLDEAINLHRSGLLDAAAEKYREILQLQPNHIDAVQLLGAACLQKGEFLSAVELLELAVQLAGPQRDFLYNLGNALRGLRRDTEAIEIYRRILQTAPADVEVLNNLGLALRSAGRTDEALACFKQAYEYAPVDVEVMCNIGLLLSDANRGDEAIEVYRKALALAPEVPELLNNLGSALQNAGDTLAALQSYRHALANKPDYAEAHSNLIFSLDFVEEGGSEAQQLERKRWAATQTAHILACTNHPNNRDAERKLRIGYISPDFREHSAAYAFSPLILDFDRERFEVVCYTNSSANDEMTRRFRESASMWREIYGLDDLQAAQLVHADGIDILVDLAAHSRNNRLGVMAYKPAPVQASGWGHANGTGMPTIDYLFSDPLYIPPEEAHFYQEKILYLPCVVGYLARPDVPLSPTLPALQNGHITFGSFSRLAKISSEVLDLWAELLQQLPGSRILFKAAELNSPLRCQELLAGMQARGVAAERIDLQPGTPWLEHVQAIATVDIALDPYPHGGGISVLDCLWMGVPVLAVQRPVPAGRVAASILNVHHLADWVATDRESFLSMALSHAEDRPALACLRAELRERVANSPVGNARTYAAAVEAHYRTIWRDFILGSGGR